MTLMEKHHAHFETLSEGIYASLHEGEALTLQLSAEDQDYIRFNQARIRQITHVEQARLTLRFQALGRRIEFTLDLTGHLESDIPLVQSLVNRARQEATILPEDPFLCPFENHGRHHERHTGTLPPLGELLQIMQLHDKRKLDLAGFYAGGSQLRAISNSEGLSQSFSSTSFFLDYSLFTVNQSGENKAFKGLYTGREWKPQELHEKLTTTEAQLDVLKAPCKRLDPGRYRVYFAPAAVEALIGMFSWGGVSYAAYRRGESALQKLIEGKAQLSPRFRLEENFDLCLTPRFNSLGEIAPPVLPIIADGEAKNLLISARTALEYGIASNCANPGEGLRSPVMSSGSLPSHKILETLGTGLYLSNLHYLNWSDRPSGRLTGMTRYACFWVERGQIIAPIQDLRFDESLFRLFGSGLEAVTETSEIIIQTDTYVQRALGGAKVPGILVDGVEFTL